MIETALESANSTPPARTVPSASSSAPAAKSRMDADVAAAGCGQVAHELRVAAQHIAPAGKDQAHALEAHAARKARRLATASPAQRRSKCALVPRRSGSNTNACARH